MQFDVHQWINEMKHPWQRCPQATAHGNFASHSCPIRRLLFQNFMYCTVTSILNVVIFAAYSSQCAVFFEKCLESTPFSGNLESEPESSIFLWLESEPESSHWNLFTWSRSQIDGVGVIHFLATGVGEGVGVINFLVTGFGVGLIWSRSRSGQWPESPIFLLR